MAAAIALTFVTVETISTRIGHAVVPIKLEAVNRLGKTDRLFDRVASITVVRGAKTALLTAVRQVPGPVVFVAANRDGKADRLAQRRITQAVVRTGKTGALVRTAALEPQAPSERANRLEKASRLAKASADQFVARGIKTDSLKLIFAALTSVEGPEKDTWPGRSRTHGHRRRCGGTGRTVGVRARHRVAQPADQCCRRTVGLRRTGQDPLNPAPGPDRNSVRRICGFPGAAGRSSARSPA